ncbi:MAG: hypothetical protein DDT33_00934 [Firmicutes bacterium]|nr:hypothetical protein [Bacillota bacterium]
MASTRQKWEKIVEGERGKFVIDLQQIWYFLVYCGKRVTFRILGQGK